MGNNSSSFVQKLCCVLCAQKVYSEHNLPYNSSSNHCMSSSNFPFGHFKVDYIYYVMAGRWIRDLSNPRSKVEEVIALGLSRLRPETEGRINPVSTDQALTLASFPGSPRARTKNRRKGESLGEFIT